MATTKKSTKAKTKTAAAKATKKTTAAKAAPKTAITSTLKKLNLLSVLASLVLAVLAGVLMSQQSYELVTGLMVKNELAGEGSALFVTAVHHVFDLELRWAVVTILLLSTIVPLMALVKKDRYASDIKNKVNLMRWLDMAIIGALMTEVIALLSGVNDLITLKLLAALVMVGAALGWVAEKRNTQANRPVKSEMVIGMVVNALPWLVIAAFAINTYAYGLIRSPWYVYALYASTLLGCLTYAMNGLAWVTKRQGYETTEKKYLLSNVFIKTAFAVILIVGLAK